MQIYLKLAKYFFPRKKKILKDQNLLIYLEERSFFFNQKITNLKKKQILKTKLSTLLKTLKNKEKKQFTFGRSKIFINETKKQKENKFLEDFDKKMIELEKTDDYLENEEEDIGEEIQEETLSDKEERMLYEYENKIRDKIEANEIAMEIEDDGIDLPEEGEEGEEEVVEDDDGEGVKRY